MTVSTRLLPNSVDEYELVAHIGSTDPKKPFRATRFSWNFGDEHKEESGRPFVTHRFDSRQPDSLFSRFLITVHAYDETGEKITSRVQVNLLNSEYENLKYKGILVLSYSLNPHFPVLDDQGVVEQKIRIWHHQPYPVKLRVARITAHLSSEEDMPGKEVDPSELFGTTVVPDSGIEATLRFDTKANEKVTLMDYQISGEGADGTPAVLHFSIMKPTPRPTRETGIAVTEPMLNAKILKAREILHAEFVTDEDLHALENTGAFAGLQPAKSEGHAPLAPPANLPKPAILATGPSPTEAEARSPAQ
jgi:hypothetical protein